MTMFRISEFDAARDFAGLLARVRAGAEVVIESGACPIAVLRTPAPPRRSIERCISLLPADSTATIDGDFASDVEAAVAHREPLNPPAWDRRRPERPRTSTVRKFRSVIPSASLLRPFTHSMRGWETTELDRSSLVSLSAYFGSNSCAIASSIPLRKLIDSGAE